MPQMWLPCFPQGMTIVNDVLAYVHEGENVTYYNAMMPIFTHHKDDVRTFRLILSQFYVNGNASQAELVKAFEIPPVTLKRAVKLYREKGPKGFFEPHKRGGPRVLKPDVVEEIERLLGEGKDKKDIAKQLGIKEGTLKKGMQQNRVKKKNPKNVTH